MITSSCLKSTFVRIVGKGIPFRKLFCNWNIPVYTKHIHLHIGNINSVYWEVQTEDNNTNETAATELKGFPNHWVTICGL